MTLLNDTKQHTGGQDFPYFHRLWKNIVVSLMAASFVPLILIGGGMYYYTSSALKQKTIESLETEVMLRKETIDRFLAERTMDLKLLSKNTDMNSLVRPGVLEDVFKSLQSELPCFQDLGIIDGHGRHLAYCGPFDLISKNYKETFWFRAVMTRDVFISDVFTGFRNEPHFIIAVRKTAEKGTRIIRSTIDTAYFNDIVSKLAGKRSVDAYLVNEKGVFQAVPNEPEKLMAQSGITEFDYFKGMRISEHEGRLRLMVWLDNVPWLCVVEIRKDEIFAQLYLVRNIGAFIFFLGGVLIVMTVLLTTNYLVSRLEFKRQSIKTMGHQLLIANKNALSLHVFSGMFHEIRSVLGNMDVMIKWSRVLARKGSPVELEDCLGQLKSEVTRGWELTDKVLTDIQPLEPVVTEIDINKMIDELIEFFHIDFSSKSIEVVTDYQDDVMIGSDRSLLRQVFQNLIHNALTAIGKEGKIIFKTRRFPEGATVTITDTGPGIPEENIERIFDPLFTTKPEAAGLGLTISADILKKLKGGISVTSEPGKGASFEVNIPLRF